MTELDVSDANAWKELGWQLRTSGYTTAEVRSQLGLAEPVEMVLGNIARYSLSCLSELESHKNASAVLARLFLFHGRLSREDLAILPARQVAILRRLGLIKPAEDGRVVSGAVSVTEYAGKYFVADRLFENLGTSFVVNDGPQLCMPPHASSLELLRALRCPGTANSFLDVGCGTGCQSMLYANGYRRVYGFDPNERAVMFARANALLNGSSAQYFVDRWETFGVVDGGFDHVVFNAPNSDSAFDFLVSKAAALISEDGKAQTWVRCEVTAEDGGLPGMVERRTGALTRLRISATRNAGSPFSLSRDQIRAGAMPRGCLLVASPREWRSYLRQLAERRVIEVVSATLDASRR